MAVDLSGNVGTVVFRADREFQKSHSNEIDLKAGDLCQVRKPIEDANGWLMGENTSTKEFGLFPASHVTPIEEGPPPRPPKRPPKKAASEDSQHAVETVAFVKPVWCLHCQDFIWGYGRQSVWCNVCHCASHVECSSHFLRMPCNALRPAENNKDDLLVDVIDWDSKNVMEWLAAIRIYDYLLLFESHFINGKQLMDLTFEELKEMEITNYFHVDMIMSCKEELLTGNTANNHSPLTPTWNGSLESRSMHQFKEHSFTSFQHCGVCQKPLFGLCRQGYICKECGFQCHRYCATQRSTGCPRKYSRARRLSDPVEPHFGRDFPAEASPLALAKIQEYLDTWVGLSTLYTASADYAITCLIRIALNESPETVNLRNEELNYPHSAAQVLRMFFMELPVPLIPFEQYNDFLDSAGVMDSTENGNFLNDCVENLPPQRKKSLQRLTTHLKDHIFACQDDPRKMDRIADVFSTVILRPRVEDSKKLAYNLGRQRRVVRNLLQLQSSLAATNAAGPTAASVNDSDKLEDAEWYWGAMIKQQVNELLMGTPDGTFLVRDSATPGEYTIALRKDGINKLIRIVHRDGKYGFLDNPPFHSVRQLVDHFRLHSLEAHNPQLKTKLLFPLSKFNVFSDVKRKLANFSKLEEDLTQATQKFHDIREWSESQMEVMYMLEEQIKLTEGCLAEVPASDKPKLEENIRYMRSRLTEEQRELQSIDEKFREVGDLCTLLSEKVTALKSDVPGLQRLYDDLLEKLQLSKKEEVEQSVAEEEEVRYDELPAVTTRPNDELPSWAWMMGNITREQAAGLLNGKPDGTFLVRSRENEQSSFAISLVYDSMVKHIVIERGPSGFGFSEPYNRYPTLDSLIKHYHKQSLRMHNPSLDTTLLFPIKFVEDNEDVYVKLERQA